MGKLFNVHPSDDQLDLYLVGHLSLEHERLIEEHYLTCGDCLDRLSSVAEFVAVLKTAAQADPLPSHAAVHRKSARFAATLLIAAGAALVCNAPAPSHDSRPTLAGLITPITPKPSAVHRQVRAIRQFVLVHRSPPHLVFQPPPQPTPALLAAYELEVPADLIIPGDWVAEQQPALLVQQLEPPPLPPFEPKPRWFRRVLAAVRKGLEPQRW